MATQSTGAGRRRFRRGVTGIERGESSLADSAPESSRPTATADAPGALTPVADATSASGLIAARRAGRETPTRGGGKASANGISLGVMAGEAILAASVRASDGASANQSCGPVAPRRRRGKAAKAVKAASAAEPVERIELGVVSFASTSHPDPAALLAWYDANRRVLPWRALPHERSDPYRVWLSEIMLQQTTVAAVQPYYTRFLQRFPTVQALAAAPSEAVMQAWAGLGYYSRARNLHACAQVVVRDHRGVFPDNIEGLLALPGIGPYTAAAIGAIAFDLPVAAVDGNVERVLSRYYRIEQPMPAAKPQIRALAQALAPQRRPGDFAQAMMDLGATICTPRSPSCLLCPWQSGCAARAAGDMERFPRKGEKKAAPQRYGAAFVLMRADGAVLLRTRPPEGLLGGMDEPPGGVWREAEAPPEAAELLHEAPFAADWRVAPGEVRHIFTHFRLSLKVFVAVAPRNFSPPLGARWEPRATLAKTALPNVMRKAVAHGLSFLNGN